MAIYEKIRGEEMPIGKGTFGTVHKVQRKWDRQVFACKIIVHGSDEVKKKKADVECAIIASLDHPNIAKFQDVESLEHETRFYMVYYQFGSLRQLIAKKKSEGAQTLPEAYVWSIVYQLTSALMYCHQGLIASAIGSPTTMANSQQIIHRDIKPENILLASRSQNALDAIKLCDFGLGFVLKEGAESFSTAGTDPYRPPEIDVSSGKKHSYMERYPWTPKCDVFSLGCTIFEIATFELLFGPSVAKRYGVSGQLGQNRETLEHFIQSCVSWEPDHRPNADELFDLACTKMDSNPEFQKDVGVQSLLRASERGDFESVFSLSEHVDINATGTNLMTPLHNAILSMNIPLVVFLLEKGADTRAQTSDGKTAVHIAAESGYNQEIETLLKHLQEKDAPIQTFDNRGWLPIHAATVYNQGTMVQNLLDMGTPIESTTDDADKATILHLAAENGHNRLFKFLLHRGANANARRSGDRSVLHTAAEQGHKSIIHILSKLVYLKVDQKAKRRNDCTALHLAVEYGRRDAALALLDMGASIREVDTAGETPLHLASRFGHEMLIQDLVDRQAALETLSLHGHTPLFVAAEQRHLPAVDCLLRNGANVHARTPDDETILHFTARGGDNAVSKCLIDAGASINACGKNRTTPLHCAVRSDRDATFKLLIAEGADTSRTTLSGDNILMLAAFYGRAELVELILEQKIIEGVNLTNSSGETALHRAARHGYVTIIRKLIEYGANPGIRSKDGSTARQIALKGRFTGCIRYLK